MKYFLIAGEASGDALGAKLMQGILRVDPNAEFEYWGGDAMQATAPGLLQHFRDITIMGFVEVLMRWREVLGNLKRCKDQVLAFKPDVLILVDYPGFNLRMAQFAKENGIKTCYYVAPKIWAWNEKRGYKLEKYVDLLLLIFPFEIDYFKKWKVNAVYVGNPLVAQANETHALPSFLAQNNLDPHKPIIALLPGSRKQEIKRMLPLMVDIANDLPPYQFLVAGAPGLDPSFYEKWKHPSVNIVFNQTPQILKHAVAAIVCSGTATLETAIMNVPQVCGYAAQELSYQIAIRVVKVKYISLVNINLDRMVISELIQKDYQKEKVLNELKLILPGGAKRETMFKDYAELRNLFGEEDAGLKGAQAIQALFKA
jgi:lipid-A-disaccharide synthase